MLLCSSGVPNSKLHLSLPELPCFVQTLIFKYKWEKSVGGSGCNGHVHLLESCTVPNSQPLLCAELKMSRERRMHMFSENRGELAVVGIKATYV